MILAPAPAERHVLMDVSRGAAILGILWLNIFIFALPFEAMVIPGIWGEHNTANIATWAFVSIGISGVMRGMISMLFGAAALTMLRNAEKAADHLTALDRFFRRLMWLIFFGVVHSYILLWPHDILYVYGVLGLLIFPFRNLDPRKMLVLAFIMLAGSVFFTAQNSNEIQDAQTAVEDLLNQQELDRLRQSPPLIDNHSEPRSNLEPSSLDNWSELVVPVSNVQTAPQASEDAPTDATTEQLDKDFSDLVERISQEIEKRQGGYSENFEIHAVDTFEEQTTEMLSNHLLDVATFFLFGIVLWKTGFLTNQWTTSRYVTCMVGGYVVGITLGLLTSLTFDEGTLLEPLATAISDYTYDVRRLCLAVANFSLFALLLRLGIARFLTNILASCGRMAFSLYISQTIICNLIFLGFGLGLYGQLEHFEIALLAVVITLLQMLVAPLYLRHYKQGPLEWLLRRLINIGLPETVQQTVPVEKKP